MKMTQFNIYESESGRFVGKRTVHEYNDRELGNLYVILEGRNFDCVFNSENMRFEV
jgi:hypothetical protein